MVKAMPHLKSEDIAAAIVYVLGTPPHVQVHTKFSSRTDYGKTFLKI